MSEPTFLIKTSDGIAPTESEVKGELLILWDAYSPLSLSALSEACHRNRTLGEVGLNASEARACTKKYNSLISRCPGKGPFVSPSEAGGWVDSPMPEIVKDIAQRSQPASKEQG